MLPYHKITSDQKVRKAIIDMVSLPYYFSTITASLHSGFKGLVHNLALRNECYPTHPSLSLPLILVLDFTFPEDPFSSCSI